MPIQSETDRVLRALNRYLVDWSSPYTFVKLDEEDLPPGTIEVDYTSIQSDPDLNVTLAHYLTNEMLMLLEKEFNWAVVADSPDGRRFRIKPTPLFQSD